MYFSCWTVLLTRPLLRGVPIEIDDECERWSTTLYMETLSALFFRQKKNENARPLIRDHFYPYIISSVAPHFKPYLGLPLRPPCNIQDIRVHFHGAFVFASGRLGISPGTQQISGLSLRYTAFLLLLRPFYASVTLYTRPAWNFHPQGLVVLSGFFLFFPPTPTQPRGIAFRAGLLS